LDGSASMSTTPYPLVVGDNNEGSVQKKTRLDAAKDAVTKMIGDLMIQSTQNLVSVVVTKTRETRYHRVRRAGKDEEDDEDDASAAARPFAHLTELTDGGMVGATVDLLKDVARIEGAVAAQTTKKKKKKESTTADVDDDATDSSEDDGGGDDDAGEDEEGDLMDAILLASDSIVQRTTGKAGGALKIERKIVVLTDAGDNWKADVGLLMGVVEQLQRLGTRLEVIGFDFASSGDFDDPLMKVEDGDCDDNTGTSAVQIIKQEQDSDDNGGGGAMDENSSGDEDETDDEDEDETDDSDDDGGGGGGESIIVVRTRKEKERFLLSLTERTGGSVRAVSTESDLAQFSTAMKTMNATRSKYELYVGPGLYAQVLCPLLIGKAPPLTLKKEAVLLDTDLKTPLKDVLGEDDEVDRVVSARQYVVKGENLYDVVPDSDVTTAIRYGSDLIPMDKIAAQGVRKMKQPPSMASGSSSSSSAGRRFEILGYMERSKVPISYLTGESRIVSGYNDKEVCTRSRALVGALAQALQQQEKVAICNCYKTNNGDPVLGALFPFSEEGSLRRLKRDEHSKPPPPPQQLVFLQLPYAGDVKMLDMQSFEEYIDADKLKATDNMIDALMLPDDALKSGTVPSPFQRSWNRTKLRRATDPGCDIVSVRSGVGTDPMKTPRDVLARSQEAIHKFRAAFSLLGKDRDVDGATKKNGNKDDNKQPPRSTGDNKQPPSNTGDNNQPTRNTDDQYIMEWI